MKKNTPNQNISIAQIVAMSRNRCIGKDNDLPWHIPADLQHFKHQTTHNQDGTLAGVTTNSDFNGVMVMGRKTFESMRSRPLPKRVNIIITRQTDYIANIVNNLPVDSVEQATDTHAQFIDWIAQGKLIIVNSLEHAIRVGKQRVTELGLDTLWVIGGGEIFRQALPITERVELTEVAIDVDGDAFYPPLLADEFEQIAGSEPLVDDKSQLAFQYLSYRRIQKQSV